MLILDWKYFFFFFLMQPELYKSIIEDVIEGVRELFAEEGVEEQVLKDLKQVCWVPLH